LPRYGCDVVEISTLSIMQQQKPNNASKAYWLSFAISRYAKSKNSTPDIVFPKLRKFGVMDFLDKHYETEQLVMFMSGTRGINRIYHLR